MVSPAANPSTEDRNDMISLFSFVGMNGSIQCFVTKAVVDLGIPDMLARAGDPMTVAEIAAQLPTKTPHLGYLARIMTFAATFKLFQDVTDYDRGDVVDDGSKRFAQTRLSEALAESETADTKLSIANWVRFLWSDYAVDSYKRFAEAVLTGKEPLVLATGKNPWELASADPGWNQVVNYSMAASATCVMADLLRSYKGFEGVGRLVDVGGNLGASLTLVTQTHPDIRGVNFDLPHVVRAAPAIPRVEHVGGNMFEKVPEGDAIFLKCILHDWTDEECVKILVNCHKSLPADGKVMLVEYVLPDARKASSADYVSDQVMLAMTSGKERTAPEWRKILNAANFQRVEFVTADISMGYLVVEAFKR